MHKINRTIEKESKETKDTGRQWIIFSMIRLVTGIILLSLILRLIMMSKSCKSWVHPKKQMVSNYNTTYVHKHTLYTYTQHIIYFTNSTDAYNIHYDIAKMQQYVYNTCHINNKRGEQSTRLRLRQYTYKMKNFDKMNIVNNYEQHKY